MGAQLQHSTDCPSIANRTGFALCVVEYVYDPSHDAFSAHLVGADDFNDKPLLFIPDELQALLRRRAAKIGAPVSYTLVLEATLDGPRLPAWWQAVTDALEADRWRRRNVNPGRWRKRRLQRSLMEEMRFIEKTLERLP